MRETFSPGDRVTIKQTGKYGVITTRDTLNSTYYVDVGDSYPKLVTAEDITKGYPRDKEIVIRKMELAQQIFDRQMELYQLELIE